MSKRWLYLALTALSFLAASQAQPKPLPEFEVASVTRSDPDAQVTGQERQWGETGRVSLTRISLSQVIERAYGLRPDQLVAPSWLAEDRFDIRANLPANASTDDLPLMFQALLQTRFKLAFHREPSTIRAYALRVLEGGPKLKPSVASEGAASSSTAPKRTLSASERAELGNSVKMSAPGSGALGPFILSMQYGVLHYEFASLSMPNLARFLSQDQLDLPVIDMTGLEGLFQVEVDITPRLLASKDTPDPSGPTTQDSLKKLGLTLVSGRVPLEKLVIDRIEQQPTAN